MLKHIRICLLIMLALNLISCAGFKMGCTNSCTDEDITTSVQVKIFSDRCMSDQFIYVSTYERVVTLTGRVTNPTQKKIATQMARSVPGVKGVKNKLEVKQLN